MRLFQKKNPPIDNRESLTEHIEVPKERITDKLDQSQFYRGYSFKVNDQITLRQPTVNNVIDMGENEYYRTIHCLTAIPQDYMSELWDTGVDFTKLSETEFLYQMTRNLDKKNSSIIFGEKIDFQKFELYSNKKEIVLYDKESDVLIDGEAQKKINEFICGMHRMKKIRYRPAGKIAKQAMIDIDRGEKREAALKKHSQTLLPLMSSMINHPGFKYNLEETLELKMFFFMDCVARILKKDSVDKLAVGYYSGSLDPKKFKPETQLNWTSDLYE